MLKVNLFCLPFAGGSSYSYDGYKKSAPPDINVIPIEIPGRGTRFKEKLLTDIHKITDDIFNQVKEHLQHPYAIYGHSMGSLLGYLLTKKISYEQLPLPKHLFFTGCNGPSVIENEPPRHLLPKDQFISKLKEIGGSPDEILEDDELMRFFEPILRADFQATDTYSYVESTPFEVSITCMIGLKEKTTDEKVQTWQKETTKRLDIKRFPGNHFFIFNYEREILKIIKSKLYPVLV